MSIDFGAQPSHHLRDMPIGQSRAGMNINARPGDMRLHSFAYGPNDSIQHSRVVNDISNMYHQMESIDCRGGEPKQNSGTAGNPRLDLSFEDHKDIIQQVKP